MTKKVKIEKQGWDVICIICYKNFATGQGADKHIKNKHRRKGV